MLRFPLLVAIALAVAFGGGIWSVRRALDATTGFGALTSGVWEAFPLAQTRAADPYARAHRARDGQLLYASAEAVSFTARRDSQGALLEANCDYALSGTSPTARLWTLRASPIDGAAPAAPDLPAALNTRMTLRDATGAFTVALSRKGQPGNWLALPQNGRFEVVLTLFDTPSVSRTGLSEITLPALEKRGCDHV